MKTNWKKFGWAANVPLSVTGKEPVELAHHKIFLKPARDPREYFRRKHGICHRMDEKMPLGLKD